MAPVTPMYWEDFYAMVTAALRGGPAVDQMLFTQMLNEARMNREAERPYKALRNQDKTQTWMGGDTWQTAKTMPADFVSFLENNPMQLWDGNVSPGSLIETVSLLPYEDLLWYNTDSYAAAVDYGGNVFYMAGTTQQTFKIIINYMADWGDILPKNATTQYTWNRIPPRFHKMLAYDVLAMYRLGVSYDDLAARNADNNGIRAELINGSMHKWDARLQRADIRNTDYYPTDTPDFVNHKVNLRGR